MSKDMNKSQKAEHRLRLIQQSSRRKYIKKGNPPWYRKLAALVRSMQWTTYIKGGPM